MISIVAPMYNEEDNLASTLNSVTNELISYGTTDFEIIFVNDGSTDNTFTKAKELEKENTNLRVVGYENNQGRGKALRTGINNAKGDIICTIDFDLTYDASHISRMIKELEKDSTLDAVLSSVYMPGGKATGVPGFRLFISKTANLLYRFAFTPRIYTSTCVVRAYRKDAIKYLELESNDKEIHLEIISKLLSNGFKIKEIPGFLTRRKEPTEHSIKRRTFKFRRHSISHIIYFIQEKPFAIFGYLGFLLIVLGLISSLILLYTRFGDNELFNSSGLSRLVSPNFVIILFLSGLQMMGIGFLGIQNNLLKKEIFKLQRMINFNFSKNEKKD